MENTVFKVDKSDIKNRKTISVTQIQPGKILMKLQPLHLTPLAQNINNFCNYCLKTFIELKICQKCNFSYYCSTKCEYDDEHKLFCQFLKENCQKEDQKQQSKNGITTLILLAIKVYFSKKDINDFYGEIDNFSMEKRRFFQETTYWILKGINMEKSEEEFSKLMKINCQIYLNSFTIQDIMFQSEGLGIALYYPANYINHSCLPNCVQIFDGSTLLIIANQLIKPDQEITISYIEQAQDMKLIQKTLQEYYLFNCKCYKCIQNVPENYIFKCQKCYKQIQNLVCQNCKNKLSTDEYQKQKLIIDQYIIKINDQNISYSQKIELIQQLDRKVIFSSNIVFLKIFENLSQQSLEQQQFKNAHHLLKIYAKNFVKWMGQELPTLGHKLNELSKLSLYLENMTDFKKYTINAYQIYEKFFKNINFPEKSELLERLSEMQMMMQQKQIQ